MFKRSFGPMGFLQKLLLSLFGLGVIGSLVGRGTMASFTATTVNPGNSFTAGTLLISSNSSSNCSAVAYATNCGTVSFSANTGMSTTGSIATGTISITNSGTVPTTMKLVAANVTGALAASLNMTVYDGGTGKCIYGAGGNAVPYAGSCDNLSALPAVTAGDTFANTAALTLPGAAGATWNPGETHTFTIVVQTVSGSPSGAAATVDFQWFGSE